jgi:2-C-methyl-D-erythritol 4-phosphate cytidylyltransferase
MKTQAIIAAAGVGERLGSRTPKPLILLAGKPLFVWAAQVFEQSSLIDSVIIVAHRKYLADFAKISIRYRLKKVKAVISGGKTRCQSVNNGLAALDPDTDLVLIHDAARPLLSEEMIQQSIRACRNVGGVIVAVPVKSTVKRVDRKHLLVKETLRRDELWEVQTPQVFPRAVIQRAHAGNKNEDVTDDAALIEQLGKKVKVVIGEYHNIKITTHDDIAVAERFLSGRS